MNKKFNLNKLVDKLLFSGICLFIFLLFIIFNIELPIILYKLYSNLNLCTLNNLQYFLHNNLINTFYFVLLVLLISFSLFIISLLILIFICVLKLNNLYTFFYIVKSIMNTIFSPTLIFLVHIYGLSTYILTTFVLFELISNIIVLGHEYYNIELQRTIMTLNQFNSNIFSYTKFKYMIKVLMHKFKNLLPNYFIDIIDNSYIYTFFIKSSVFLVAIENITKDANMNNSFILTYLILQVIIYFIFIIYFFIVKF